MSSGSQPGRAILFGFDGASVPILVSVRAIPGCGIEQAEPGNLRRIFRRKSLRTPTKPAAISVMCHIEKLHNLEFLLSTGFVVSCFPVRIERVSAGWIRAVAIIDG